MKTVTKIAPNPLMILEKKKLRVAAYCRVSTASTEQKESLETQKEHYEQYITANPDWEFAGIYYDEGITGTSMEKRSGLKDLLNACDLGQVDFIVTKSISRFARNTVDCLEMVRHLVDINVYLHFEKENINTSEMDGELILSLLSSFAQSESESISENQKWSIRARFRNGTYKVGYPPYGYKNVGGKMAVVHEEAEVVKRIFQEALTGRGTYSIAKVLNAEGVATKRGGKWNFTTVLSILINEKYTGDIVFQKTFVSSNYKKMTNRGELEQFHLTEHHEPIVSHENFEDVQELIRQHRCEKNIEQGSEKYNKRYTLSGKILCGNCGGHFRRRRHYKSAGSYVAWVCKTHIDDKSKCQMKFIYEERVFSSFITMINKLVYGYKEVLLPLLHGLGEMTNENRISEIEELEQKISKNTERKQVMAELLSKKILDSELFRKELACINAETEKLKLESKRLGVFDKSSIGQLGELESLIHFLSKKQRIREFDEELFMRFVKNVIVYSREEIGFHLKCGITLRERMVD